MCTTVSQHGHSERVRAYTHMVGEELKITGPALDHLRWSALLHDIGKLLVWAEILNKPGKLTDAEFDAIKQHPEFGRRARCPARRLARRFRTGGLGAPRTVGRSGLPGWAQSGTEISLAGRIVAVTDAFDVMTSARSYKEPISPVAARAELARCAGSQFDATIVQGLPERLTGPLADGDGSVVVVDATFVRAAVARDRRRHQAPPL